MWVSLVPAAAGQSLGEVGGPEQRGLESSTISEHGLGNVWKVVGAVGIHLEFYGENMKYDDSFLAHHGVSNLLFDQTYQAADSVLDRLPAHRRNLFEEEHRKLSKDSSSAFQTVPTILTLCQINLDEFPTITTSGICSSSCLILIDSQKAFACDSIIKIFQWCSDHKPVLDEFVVF